MFSRPGLLGIRLSCENASRVLEYSCRVQASVSIQVSAALSENVYSTRAAVAELVVIASDEFGRGLGRYERQAKDHIGFTVNCKTAGCVALGDL